MCCIQKLDNYLLGRLINAFGNIEKIYIISNDGFYFKDILKKNKLFFSKGILGRFLNSKLKIQVELLYKNIRLKEIDIGKIGIVDRYIYSCIYGNIELLKSSLKKIHIYNNENMSKYGKIKYNYFLNNKNIKENINVCFGYDNIKKNATNIAIIKIANISELRSIDIKRLDKSNLYIFNLYNINNILQICDILFIVEAMYEDKIVYLVDEMLNCGKEILVLPGDVWNKNNYFSNYLIREGANVILNINDINLYL